MENYNSLLKLDYKMPIIKLVSMEPNRERFSAIRSTSFRRFVSWALATRKRRFALDEGFELELDKFSDERLNGKLTVPSLLNGEVIEFDGASIPLPWLVATLSSDVLRPLGAILIPSIVHDYLFRCGEIEVNGVVQVVDRETADRLFKEMFETVSGLRWWPWVAWIVVRVGSPIVPYNGKIRGWNREGVITVLALLLLSIALLFISHAVFGTLFIILFAIKLLDIAIDYFTGPYRVQNQ